MFTWPYSSGAFFLMEAKGERLTNCSNSFNQKSLKQFRNWKHTMKLSIKVLFIHSAILFFEELMSSVSRYLQLCRKLLNSSQQNSNSLSILECFTYFLICFSINIFHTLKVSNTLLFCFKKTLQSFLEKSSITKTSNKDLVLKAP